jgi:hypothetical protein
MFLAIGFLKSPANEPTGRHSAASLLSLCATRSEPPQPKAKNRGNDQGDPAYAHWDRQRSDYDLSLVDQPQEMRNCKNAEENAGDAQSSFW